MGETNHRRHWRHRLILAGVLLTLVLLAGVSVLTYLAYQGAASDLVIERDEQVAYLSAVRLKDELAKFSEVLISLARTPEIYHGDPEHGAAALRRAGNRLAVFDSGVVILDHFGKVIAAQPPRPEILGQDWSDRDFFRGLLSASGVVFSDASNDGPGSASVIVISVPVLGENGEFVGAVAGMFGLGEPTISSFYASIIRLRLGRTGNTYVVDGRGTVLYDSAYRKVGNVFQFSRLPGYPADAGAGRMRDPEGNDIVAAYAAVPGTAWTLVGEDDWAAVTASTRRYARLLLAMLVLCAVLPSVGVALLVRQQSVELLERERAVQEARAANLIQRKLNPRQVPSLPGWELALRYQPSIAGGGDFHDFLLLPDGRLMLAVGNAAEQSFAAVHVMTTVRATLRSAARNSLAPAEALAHSNLLLCPEVAPDTGVRCLYAILEPTCGQLAFATAGISIPILSGSHDSHALAAVGTPLGVALDAQYEAHPLILQPGSSLVIFSEGLIRARNLAGEEYGRGRLAAVTAKPHTGAETLADEIIGELKDFTGRDSAGIDDITLVVLHREATSVPTNGRG